jgi:hypothetical protein
LENFLSVRRQLQNGHALPRTKPRNQHSHAIGKFQSVVMRIASAQIGLSEAGNTTAELAGAIAP